MSGVEKQFDNNEISGTNWTSDESGTENQINSSSPPTDDMEGGDYSMQYPNPSTPAAGEAIEIGPDGGKR